MAKLTEQQKHALLNECVTNAYWSKQKVKELAINIFNGDTSFEKFIEYMPSRPQEELKKMVNLLNEMKQHPWSFSREDMADYITSGTFTKEDLVDSTNILTEHAYNHIIKYPKLMDEQRWLPVSRLENPHSIEGNTDVYFFGVSGAGKTCALAGLIALTGQLGFKFDPRGPGGGGNYAMDLRNYARNSMLPPATDQQYIQVIDAEIYDEDSDLSGISVIEMSGKQIAEFVAQAKNNDDSFEALGSGAKGLMKNKNQKILFFVIDPENEKNVDMGDGQILKVRQSDMLIRVLSLLKRNGSFMRKVEAIHVILTKSDTLGDNIDMNLIQYKLNEQEYSAALSEIKDICQQYDINKSSGFHPGIYPFSIGKFMPGEVYTFDETDSVKILRAIQYNINYRSVPYRTGGIAGWFNS